MKKIIAITVFLLGVHGANYAHASAPEPATMQPAPAMAVPVAMAAPMPAPMVEAMAPEMAPAGSVAKPEPMEAPKPKAAEKASEKPVEKAAPKAEEKASAKVAPKESGWDKADKWIGRIRDLAMALLSLVALILGWVGVGDWRKNARLQKILAYADKAFPMVEALAKKTEWKGDDKLVEFMKRVSDWLKGGGDKDLSVDEVALLKKEAADKAAELKGDGEKVDEKVVKRANA